MRLRGRMGDLHPNEGSALGTRKASIREGFRSPLFVVWILFRQVGVLAARTEILQLAQPVAMELQRVDLVILHALRANVMLRQVCIYAYWLVQQTSRIWRNRAVLGKSTLKLAPPGELVSGIAQVILQLKDCRLGFNEAALCISNDAEQFGCFRLHCDILLQASDALRNITSRGQRSQAACNHIQHGFTRFRLVVTA